MHANLPTQGAIGDPRIALVERERRSDTRLECCGADVIIAWSHDLSERVRLRLLNLSESGMSVSSRLPLIPDATGVAISILPECVALNRVFSVIWVRENAWLDGFSAGLRFLV